MTTRLPSDPSLLVQDRFDRVPDAQNDDGEVTIWALVESHLSDPKITSIPALIGTIDELAWCLHDDASYIPSNYDGLRQVWEAEFTNDPDAFAKTWPQLLPLALSLPDLFPSHTLSHLSVSSPTITFPSKQTACLLLHSLLLTIPRAKLATNPDAEERVTSFGLWYARPHSWEGAQDAYVRALLRYLHLVIDGADEVQRDVRFELRDVGNEEWKTVREKGKEVSMRNVDVELMGPADITSDTGLEKLLGLPNGASVIAANKNPGLGPHSTQEELVLGASPPLCLVSLLSTTLSDTQVLTAHGSIAIISITGSSRNAHFDRFVHQLPFEWQKRCVIWMDALELSKRDDGGLADLEHGNVEREVRKAWTGFSAGEFDVVETGLWGCGAFGGDRRVKFLCQWIAAALAGLRLRYVVTEEKDVAFLGEVEGFVKEMSGTSWTAASLLTYLEELRPLDIGAEGLLAMVLEVGDYSG